MLVVIPVSRSDSSLIPDFSGIMKFFGPYAGHEALIVARPSDAEFGKELFAELDGAFDRVSLHILEADGPIGWPEGPNHYWSSTAHHLQFERRNALPWLWMELDTTPLTEGWLDAIETEYNLVKMPFLGVLETTHATNSKKERLTMGEHLVGVAVYPPNLGEYSTLYLYASKMPTAFDVLCQWEFVPRAHNSKLFQHGFRTQNYSRNAGGAFQGEDTNGFPNGIRFDAPIREDAVLFHGCDDGSLARAIMSEKIPQISDKIEEPIKIDTDILAPRRKRSRAAA